MAMKQYGRLLWAPHNKAFAAVRTLPDVKKAVGSHAHRIANKAGPGYKASPVEVTGGRIRARASVAPATTEAIRDNAKNQTLLKALGS